MLPYFVMVAVPAYLALFLYLYRRRFQNVSPSDYEFLQKKSYRIIIDTFFIIWLLLLLFRAESVGVDLNTYKHHFNVFADMDWMNVFKNVFDRSLEPIYYLICKIVSLFTSNFQWVMVICALIAVIPIWKLYREEGQHGFLVMVLFINVAPFVMYFSGLRQSMAMAFVLPCYHYCKDKKLWKFLLMVFLAYFFHKSALILALLYPVYHLRLKKQIYILYLLPVAGLIYIFKQPIFLFLAYFLSNDYTENLAVKATGAYAVLLLLAVFLVYCFLMVDQEKLDEDTAGLRNILVLCVFLQAFSGVHTLAMRMNYYFLLFVPLLIDRVLRIGNEKYSFLMKASKICIVCFFTVYYFYYAYTDSDILQVYPYISIF